MKNPGALLAATAMLVALAHAGATRPVEEHVVLVADRVVTEITGFATPSGNIACYIGPEYVRCDIRERDWAPPPRPADCPSYSGFGQGLQIADGDATFVCAGDTALNSDSVVDYGDSISSGALRCEVRTNGVNCADDASGHGFFLSREGFDLY